MSRQNVYLNRYAWPERVFPKGTITGNPEMIVVIPAYCEKDISSALVALHQCHPPEKEVAILIIVNEPDEADDATKLSNQQCLDEIVSVPTRYKQYVKHVQLPPKKAGVGLARKIGMDEAIRLFEDQMTDGIIICYDADCTCEPNYLQAVSSFYEDPKHNLGLVFYEHQLGGTHHRAILNYELYLRYYIDALRVAHYPYAIQTLGSCITVRSSAYQKQGGMNTRKAGEDFYFIHKLMPLGGVGEIHDTTIYPSDRISHRVPFGTGHAINKYLSDSNTDYPVYHPQIFLDFQSANLHLSDLFQKGTIGQLPESLKSFYEDQGFDQSLQMILSQSGNYDNFLQRYYRWWDGFKVLKYVHFSRDHFFPNVPIKTATDWLFEQLPKTATQPLKLADRLKALRVYDRQHPVYIR